MKACKRILEVVAAISMATIWLVTFLQVLGRYVLARPLGYSLELITLAFLVSIYIGTALVHMDGEEGHLGFDPVMNLIKGKWRTNLQILGDVLIIAFLVLMFVSGLYAVRAGWASTLPLSGIPVAWKYMPVPVAAAIMLVASVIRLVRTVKKPGNHTKEVRS